VPVARAREIARERAQEIEREKTKRPKSGSCEILCVCKCAQFVCKRDTSTFELAFFFADSQRERELTREHQSATARVSSVSVKRREVSMETNCHLGAIVRGLGRGERCVCVFSESSNSRFVRNAGVYRFCAG